MPVGTFAQRLRQAMSAKGVSQSDLARAVGYSTTGVWNWLQGNTFPRAETLASVVNFLSIDEGWLVGGPSQEGAEEGGGGVASLSVSETIAAKVESLRSEIAALTGYEPQRVRLKIEFCAP